MLKYAHEGSASGPCKLNFLLPGAERGAGRRGREHVQAILRAQVGLYTDIKAKIRKRLCYGSQTASDWTRHRQ
eukprot:1939700-Pyramimonas_sp.AAC.1